MKLTVITVVYNELEGLKKTIASVSLYLEQDIEYWIIDGSDNNLIREYLQSQPNTKINWISEADKGLYDAMNKGIDRANGDYLIYINAGDKFFSGLLLSSIFDQANNENSVILGYSIEVFAEDRYLRPGIGHESIVFSSPSHPATLYPRAFYEKNKYRLDKPIGADGNFTARAIAQHGALFVPVIISEFELGGLSSTYGPTSVKLRLSENQSLGAVLRLVAKVSMYYLLPRKMFYRALASWKYTKLKKGVAPFLNERTISRPAK